MTIDELRKRLHLEIVAGEKGVHKEVKDAFVGDLLSLVMAHAEEEAVWVTVQGHINSVAVAVLVNLPAIILTQGILPSLEMIQKANEEGIVVLITSKSSFETASALAPLLNEVQP